MGSPNPSPADGFAKRVSRTVLTSGGPQKCVAVMARREVVRKKVFANSERRIERAQIYVYDRTRRTALAAIVPFGIGFRE